MNDSIQIAPAGISVVVPTYNRSDLLIETLDSILAQDLPAREIIVVDDGSKDDTPSVLARYAPRVQSIRISNSGDLVARNTGLRAATSRLVAFCDSDDLWRPNFLSAMARFWTLEPRLFAAYSDFVVVRDNIWLQQSKFAAAPPSFWSGMRQVAPTYGVFDVPIPERLVRFQLFFTSCMAVDRAALLAAGGWDEGVSRMRGCDFATALRVAEHPPIGLLRQPLVGIRKHPGNFSGDVEKMNLGDADVLEYVLRTRPTLAPFTSQIRDSIGDRRNDALDSAFARRDFAAVRAIYALPAGSRRDARHLIKHAISRLPNSVAGTLAAFLSRN